MNKPHKHAAIIKAWADGAEIQHYHLKMGWTDCSPVFWYADHEYRVKPEPEPDIVRYARVNIEGNLYQGHSFIHKHGCCNVKAVFDGETGELKEAHVL